MDIWILEPLASLSMNWNPFYIIRVFDLLIDFSLISY